jgi:hypothetical protein
MGELARWNLKVSRETDIALRTLLAKRGGKKGDLSRFVEEAVNREVLRETVRAIKERNAGLDPAKLEQLIEHELSAVRSAAFRAEAHRQSARVAESTFAREDQEFIDAITGLD